MQQDTNTMKLPKIHREDLPKEVQDLVGDGDYEFESLLHAYDIIDVPLDLDSYNEGRAKTAEELIKIRKEIEEMRIKERKRKRA